MGFFDKFRHKAAKAIDDSQPMPMALALANIDHNFAPEHAGFPDKAKPEKLAERVEPEVTDLKEVLRARVASLPVRFGLDYAWGAPIAPAAHHAIGSTFAARYLSYDPSKDLSRNEWAQLRSNGLDVVTVWETTGVTALGGQAAGARDAQAALQTANSLGIPGGRPIYFAIDWDETPAQAGVVDAYFQGIASVLGHGRTGAYGGYWVVKRLFDAGHISYAWQTYAWSGGNLDPRAHLYQYSNSHWVAGVSVDYNHSLKLDFGQWDFQWPTPTPNPSPKPTPPAPALNWPLIRQGSRNVDTRTIQWLLLEHGIGVTIDGIYGVNTSGSVRTFQSKNGLGADGIVGPNTWAKLIRQVQDGSSGNAVKAIQSQLNVAIDGAFGPKTVAAVKNFQKNHKLTIDGVVGLRTWNALANAGK